MKLGSLACGVACGGDAGAHGCGSVYACVRGGGVGTLTCTDDGYCEGLPERGGRVERSGYVKVMVTVQVKVTVKVKVTVRVEVR